MTDSLAIEVPEELVERIARRAAAILEERNGNGSPWLTRSEAAEYLRLPLSRLEKDRTLPCHRDGRRVLYFKPELDDHFRGLG